MRSVLPSAIVTVCLITTVHAAPPEFHTAVTADAPMLWYRFNENVGAAQAVNYGSLGATHNGVYRNNVTLQTPTSGGDTGAGFIAAQQQWVESLGVAPASLTGNPSFTAEAVVFFGPQTQNPNYSPFLHWGAPATGRSVYFSTWNTIANRGYVGFYNGGLRMRCNLRSNAWNHLVWVRDSAGGTNGQYVGTTLYVNGEVAALEQDTVLPGAPVINVSATTFRVQRATDLTRHFTGTMDEVVLYDHLLTAEQVRAHFLALGVPPVVCRANVNGDCDLNSQDFFDFLARFFDNNGDYNEDGSTNSQDFFDFVSDFFSGCN